MKESVSEKEIFSVNQFIAEKNYWLEKMSGELTRSAFPYDFKGKDMQGEERLLVKFDIAAEQLNRLNKLSAGSDMKLHMILTACISLLLYKYTGDEDIIVGSPIYQQDIEGEFINTVLAFRNQISKKNTFKEFLLLVRQTMIEAVKNQNYPIEKLLYLMDISNDFEGFPLFDSLILLNTVHNRSYVEGIKTNILFQFDRKEQSLEGIIEYNASAYKTDTIERMIYHLSLLMEQVINNVDIKIEAIDIISKQEREQLLDHFNQTQVQQYSDSLLHQLFENQVTKTPTQPAIIFEGQSLSYQELNQKANQLALRLRQSGVSAGEIVGIMSKRSLQMMIAILGILKSGGAYVPIDPDYPEDRVEFVLKDSRVSRLLVYCNEEYTNLNDIEIFNLNDVVLYQGETTDLPHNSRPTDLAYVIYTSGTTGTPKGVLINHKGIVNTILWRQSEYGLTTSDRVLQLFSYSFDGFLTSAFTPLIAGATVVFLNDADAKDPLAISALIGKHRVSHFISVPVLYDAILDSISPTDLKNINMVT
jgi:non-ribosomal peptide synthetase component F